MKIIKRNGSEAVFDISKIIAAVTKANNVVASNQRLTKEQITAIADDVAQECQSRNHANERGGDPGSGGRRHHADQCV